MLLYYYFCFRLTALLYLIEETEQPQWNLIVVSNLCIVSCVVSIFIETSLER